MTRERRRIPSPAVVTAVRSGLRTGNECSHKLQSRHLLRRTNTQIRRHQGSRCPSLPWRELRYRLCGPLALGRVMLMTANYTKVDFMYCCRDGSCAVFILLDIVHKLCRAPDPKLLLSSSWTGLGVHDGDGVLWEQYLFPSIVALLTPNSTCT